MTYVQLAYLAIQAAIAVAATAVINAIFPTKVDMPKLSDLRIQTSTLGNPIPISRGPENRLAGNVFWSTGLLETQHVESGGKGGSTETTSYSYRTSVAVGLAEGLQAGVRKVWGNGKLIYDADRADETTVDATPQSLSFPFGNILGAVFFYLRLRFNHAESTQTLFSAIRFYPGDFDQLPDPLIESYLGVGEVPGYRGLAYAVIEDLQLADFGNVVPNLEFLLVGDPNETVKKTADFIFRKAGIPEDSFNSNALGTVPLRGYSIGRVATASQAFAPLAFAFNFDVVDQAGDLRLQPRDDNVVAIISNDVLGGHQYGAERPDPIQWERQPVTTLPREASITFADPERDYQPNAVSSRRLTGSADSNLVIELPLTLTPTQAKALADRALWESWIGQQIGRAQATDQLIEMQPGRLYLFETPAGLEPLRVYSKTRGKNGVIEFELKRERAEIYQSTQVGPSTPTPPNEIPMPGPTELILLDIPILRDADDDAGFYECVVGSETGWRGCQIYRALDISSDYSVIESLGFQAVVGDMESTLGDGPTELSDGPGTFDDVNYFDVTLRHGGMTLESVTDAAIEAGENAFFVGDPDDTTLGEIIQAGTIDLQSGDTWRLSHLRRGQRGTEFATGLHAPGEICVKLDAGTLRRENFGFVDLNIERAYKGVSLLLDPLDQTAVLFTNTGVGLRPFSPRDLDVSGDTGGDLILSWTRRSRLNSGDLGEASELYTLRIMDAPGTTIIREAAVAAEQFFTYTLAMQTADFAGAVSDLRWRVAQVSATYGNGIFAEFNGPIPVSG